MPMHFNARIPARNFGFASDKTVLGFLPGSIQIQHPLAQLPRLDADHIFEAMFFEQMKLWWEWHDTSAPLYISGPSGCGKTTGVLQFMARANMPCVVCTCRHSMDKTDLIGQWGVNDTQGKFVWFDGPVSVAWKYGYTLVINEFSVAPAQVWVALNDLFEGAALVNDRLGNAIDRHPNTRIVITDNCRALGDSDDGFVGRRRQDVSSAERFWHIEARWPDREAEARLLRSKALHMQGDAQLDIDAIVQGAMNLADKTREMAADPEIRFDTTRPPAVSTRVLIRMVEILTLLLADGAHKRADALAIAVDLALAKALDPQRAVMLQDWAHSAYGSCLASIEAEQRAAARAGRAGAKTPGQPAQASEDATEAGSPARKRRTRAKAKSA